VGNRDLNLLLAFRFITALEGKKGWMAGARSGKGAEEGVGI